MVNYKKHSTKIKYLSMRNFYVYTVHKTFLIRGTKMEPVNQIADRKSGGNAYFDSMVRELANTLTAENKFTHIDFGSIQSRILSRLHEKRMGGNLVPILQNLQTTLINEGKAEELYILQRAYPERISRTDVIRAYVQQKILILEKEIGKLKLAPPKKSLLNSQLKIYNEAKKEKEDLLVDYKHLLNLKPEEPGLYDWFLETNSLPVQDYFLQKRYSRLQKALETINLQANDT